MKGGEYGNALQAALEGWSHERTRVRPRLFVPYRRKYRTGNTERRTRHQHRGWIAVATSEIVGSVSTSTRHRILGYLVLKRLRKSGYLWMRLEITLQ